jgi:outer membrane protein TolC
VLVNNIEVNLIEAENSVKLAQWRLKALMGMDLDINIDCAGSLADYQSQLYGDYLSTDTSLADNSDLAQLELQTKLLNQTIKLRKLDYVPTLTAAFLYQWNAMDNSFKFSQYQWNPYSMVGVTLTVPIFSGGSRYYKIKESNMTLEQLKLQREDVERGLNLVVRQSMDQMSTCIKKFSAAQRSVEQAEKGYLISQKRYDTGAGTLLELNDAELALTQSRLNYNQAIYEYVVAKSNLDKIAGRQN